MEQPGGAVSCPRCGGGLAAGRCSDCGLSLTQAQVAELASLSDLRRWTDDRRSWIVATAEYNARYGAVGETPGGASPPASAVPSTDSPGASPGTLGAQGCLLTAGAFALVAAGITFVAVAWGSLSDAGRFLVLLLAGVLALVIASAAASRIRATATTVAIAGALLIVVDAVFLMLSADPDAALPSAGLVAGLGVAGMAYGRRTRPRLPLGAAIVALAGAALILLAGAAYPTLADLDLATYAWWGAIVFAAWGKGLLGWALRDDTAPWPWPATAALLVAGGFLADAVAQWLPEITGVDLSWLAVAVVLLGVAAGLLVWDRLTHARWLALAAGAVLQHLLALMVIVATADDPPQRPWIALALLLWAGSWVGLVAHLRVHHPPEARWLMMASPWIGGLLSAGALALLVAPWSSLAQLPGGSASRVAVSDAYPVWRGVLVGLLSCGLAAAAVALLRRRRGGGTGPWSVPQLLPGWPLVVLAAWSVLANNDVIWVSASDSDWAQAGVSRVIAPALTAALLVTGFGVIGLAVWARTVWALWLGAAAAVLGVLVARGPVDIEGWLLAPELLGLALALPLALAGALHVILADGRRVPTVFSFAPALSALLLPSTVSVIGDTTERWFSGIFAAEEQIATAALVRGLALAVLAAVLVAVGARERLAGIFWPALVCLVVVVGAQVVDLADRLPPWIVLSVIGVLLVAVGARWEWVRAQGDRGRRWAGALR